jgi:serine protease Do
MNEGRIMPALCPGQTSTGTKASWMRSSILHRSNRVRSTILPLVIVATAAGCKQSDRLYSSAAGQPSFAPVVQEVMPAVVNVSAVQRLSRADRDYDTPLSRVENHDAVGGAASVDELLRSYLDGRHHRLRSNPKVASVALGSGFIIDPSGYVVTDDHVVENAEAVAVVAQDATEYPARIVGRDPLTDLALLKIEGVGPLPHVRWGDSDAARVGDWVLAIGSPFGLDNTVSSGIISGRGRDLHTGPYDDFLQIDAAMNRGNSGGPTFDLNGNVIGINTAIYSPNGGSVGIGFAIPANRARPVVEQLRERGKVARGWLGVQVQPVTPEIARDLSLPNTAGALVIKVGTGSPAAIAGFERGDVILSVDGHEVKRMHDLPLAIRRRNTAVSLWPVIVEMPENPAVAELRRSNGAVRTPVSAMSPAI